VRGLNLGLRFLLELCALAALAFGGWHAGGPVLVRLVIAVALPLTAAVVWGRWVAPRAKYLLPDPLRLLPEWLVFGGAAVALVVTGHPILGAVLATLAALNRWALHLLGTPMSGTPTDDDTPKSGVPA
jgi:hypothetical protein